MFDLVTGKARHLASHPTLPIVISTTTQEGMVILEALVERDESVTEVKVLRSAGPVLDREAMIAVRQWQYSPLVLHGRHSRFVVTVILSFSVERRTQRYYAVRAK